MKKYIISLLFIGLCTLSNAQDQFYYSDVQSPRLAEDARSGKQSEFNYTTYYMVGNLYAAKYVFETFMNASNDKKKAARLREESGMKISMLKNNYMSLDKYPDSIVTGWHNIVVTDNLNFCRDAKVYVEKNRIRDFVIDNCIHLNFIAAGSIKKGKNVVTLKNFNGEQLEVTDAYFMYDMEEPVLVDAPGQPGYICLWTSSWKYMKKRIKVNGSYIEQFTASFNENPGCFQTGCICLVFKPGSYPITIERHGSDYVGSFDIKAGKCLNYRVR
jgi:hypothetical protein